MVLSRVGVLGGTFDPVHRGHLEIAGSAMNKASLDRVIFIPAAQPRLKPGEPSADQWQRLEMLRLAVADTSCFEVSDIEFHRPGPTLTVETLRELRENLRGNAELWFILGLDVLARFEQWVEPEGVVELARLLAVSRPGYSGFDWAGFYARNPYARGRVECLDSVAVDVSASELRRRIAAGAPVSGLLPAAVEQYIRDNGLYKEQAGDEHGE